METLTLYLDYYQIALIILQYQHLFLDLSNRGIQVQIFNFNIFVASFKSTLISLIMGPYGFYFKGSKLLFCNTVFIG